jgi:hypothetical protein
MICALHRMVYQGWDRAKAIEEMRKGDYRFHSIWRGLVDYLERVDVEALRKEVATPLAGGAVVRLEWSFVRPTSASP